MSSLTALILATLFLYIWRRAILYRSFIKAKNDYENIKDELSRKSCQNSKLKNENSAQEKTAEETIALYDITKDICKSLDEDKIFSNFCEHLNNYIELGGCRFIKEGFDPLQFKESTVLPLRIDKNYVPYLVADHVKEEDRDKFSVLAQQFHLGIQRAFLYQKVQELAITDSLTQIFSRRYLLERFQEEIERSQKFKYNFSFLMIDIDHFKDYNDRYGHLVGDTILKTVARTIKESIRQIDLVGRYGGEEFSIILTETDKNEAQFAAERLRQAIESKDIKAYDEQLKVTISIGIATFPADAEDGQILIDRADWALYRAKETGRNRVCVYGVYE